LEVKVSIDVTNVGPRAGAEVVQLYVGELHPKIPRPIKELKGFEKVWLKPGETRTVTFELDESAFAFYDVSNKRWAAAPGAYDILVGSSSRELRAKGQFTIAK
jgi:beta-glucosidase